MLKSLALTLLLLIIPLAVLGAIQVGVEGINEYFMKKESYVVKPNEFENNAKPIKSYDND